MTESYFFVDGTPTSLDALCAREPAWAANRIRAMRATIDELTAKIEGSSAPVEWVDGRATVGDVTLNVWQSEIQPTARAEGSSPGRCRRCRGPGRTGSGGVSQSAATSTSCGAAALSADGSTPST